MKNKFEYFAKFSIAIILISIYLFTRYYHGIYTNPIGYGSGDAYGVMVDALTLQNKGIDNYLVSYFYKILHEITKISFYEISFYATPILGAIIILVIFIILNKSFGFIASTIGTLLIILNPHLAYHSTETSKEIFVLFFIFISVFYLLEFKDTKNFKYLIVSYILYCIGLLFYHSILLFLPIYLLLAFIFITKNIKRDIHTKRKILKKTFLWISLFFIFISVISAPIYIINEMKFRERIALKSPLLKTEIDKEGNFLQRQVGSMFYALVYDRQKLGVASLSRGVQSFTLNHNELIYLYFFSILFSIFVYFKYRNSTLLVLTSITSFTFLLIGVQWTSYSHTSRYPQYILYFFLICSSVPLSWIITGIQSKKLKLFITALIISLIVLISDPLSRVDYFRNIYSSHKEIGERAKKANLALNQNSQFLYIGWPSITMSLVNSYGPETLSFINTFGFGETNLDGITSSEYIKEKNIKYFIFNNLGSDYFDSNNIVFNNLKKEYLLTPIARTNSSYGSNIIYEIKNK